MATLYIANKNYSSWSLRPWLLVQELQLPVAIELVAFHGASGGPSFAELSPSQKLPVLHDGPHRVWDSLAIIETLAEREPQVWPADPWARAWARSASAEMHSGFSRLRQYASMNIGVRVQWTKLSAATLAELQSELDRLDTLWTEGLDRFGGPFLAGAQFSAVDAFYAPICFRLQTYGLRLSARAMEWVAMMLDRPSMRQWAQDALQEPWIDAAHDQDLIAVGIVTQDLRQAHHSSPKKPPL